MNTTSLRPKARRPSITAAISITFNPLPGEIERVTETTLPQVDLLIVVDNGSARDVSPRLPIGNRNLQFIGLGENRGIAAAMNVGIEAARLAGATHILLLDQDSELASDMVKRLHGALDIVESRGFRAGALGPRYLDPRQENPPPFIRVEGLHLVRCSCDSADAVVPVDYLISSGSLIPMATIDAVGGMDESLFIDYVDIEWGLRAKALGYQSFGVCAAAMRHSLGENPIEFLGRKLPLHSPLRHYYHFRNAMALYRRRGLPWNWKLVDGYRLLLKFGFYSLFAKPRREHLRMMALGLWHGATGRSGPLRR